MKRYLNFFPFWLLRGQRAQRASEGQFQSCALFSWVNRAAIQPFFFAAAQLHVAVEQHVTPHNDATWLAIVFASASLSQLAETRPFLLKTCNPSISKSDCHHWYPTGMWTDFVLQGCAERCLQQLPLSFVTLPKKIILWCLERIENKCQEEENIWSRNWNVCPCFLSNILLPHTHLFCCLITGFETTK